MSAFSSLPVFLQTLIPLLLFVEAVLELGLFIYQLSHHSKFHNKLPSIVIFAFLLMLLFSVTQGVQRQGCIFIRCALADFHYGNFSCCCSFCLCYDERVSPPKEHAISIFR